MKIHVLIIAQCPCEKIDGIQNARCTTWFILFIVFMIMNPLKSLQFLLKGLFYLKDSAKGSFFYLICVGWEPFRMQR